MFGFKKEEKKLSSEEEKILMEFRELIRLVAKADDNLNSNLFLNKIEQEIFPQVAKLPRNSDFKILNELSNLRGVCKNAEELYSQLVIFLRRLS